MSYIEEIDITYGGALGEVGFHKVSLKNGESFDLSGDKKLSIFIWYKEGKKGLKSLSFSTLENQKDEILIKKSIDSLNKQDSLYLSYSVGSKRENNLITSILLCTEPEISIFIFTFRF